VATVGLSLTLSIPGLTLLASFNSYSHIKGCPYGQSQAASLCLIPINARHMATMQWSQGAMAAKGKAKITGALTCPPE